LCRNLHRNLVIEQDLTLIGFGQGTGSGDTILRGNGAESVVIIEAGEVRIEQLRITGGGMTSSGGGIHIVAGATLQLSGCTVTGNNTNDGYGNGIYNEGTLTVDDCTISENGLDAPGAPYGGAIYNGGTLTVTNSALTGNRANSGAGLYEISSAAAITLTGCDISDNVAVPDAAYEAQGGAIYSWSDAESTLPTAPSATIAGRSTAARSICSPPPRSLRTARSAATAPVRGAAASITAVPKVTPRLRLTTPM
jgi:hypothetical protein